jgi:hypothetical protein
MPQPQRSLIGGQFRPIIIVPELKSFGLRIASAAPDPVKS